MIPPNYTPWEPNIWSAELRAAFRQPRDLLAYLGLAADFPADSIDNAPDFAMLVPRGFARRMRPRTDDPLLLQVLPQRAESIAAPGFVDDPLEERNSELARSLIQKYHGRVLLITTPACAINCRYCFRKHFPYEEHRGSGHGAAIAAIAADDSISEVILSGGDPLLLTDKAIADLIEALNAIDHVARIRIHSRIPVVLPERTTAHLLTTLAASRAAITLVVHANHPNELDDATARAFACFKASGAWLFNQSVLLRGVNDAVATQVALAHALFRQGALPYYLHLPDRVFGTQHFFVTDDEAQVIYRGMQAVLPGYLLPRLVREVPGAPSKTILGG